MQHHGQIQVINIHKSQCLNKIFTELTRLFINLMLSTMPMKKFVLLPVLICIIFSCTNKMSLQKRRYRKGFYVATHHNINDKSDKRLGHYTGDENKSTEAKPVLSVLVKETSEKAGSNMPELKSENDNLTDKVAAEKKHKQTKYTSFKKMQVLNAGEKQIKKDLFSSKRMKKKISKRSAGEVISTIFIGYLVIVFVELFIAGIATVGLVQTLLITALIILVLFILYAIGKLVRSILQ